MKLTIEDFIVIAFLLLMCTVLVVTLKRDHDFKVECERKGGKYGEIESRRACIDPKAVIK